MPEEEGRVALETKPPQEGAKYDSVIKQWIVPGKRLTFLEQLLDRLNELSRSFPAEDSETA